MADFDVDALPTADLATAQSIKLQALAAGGIQAGAPVDIAAIKIAAGVERWPVKTGTDPDVNKVQRQIVDTTVEELTRIPRSADMSPPTQIFPAYQNERNAPVETTIWRLQGQVTLIKMEADGDYHLVIQGASGATLIAEIPNPTPAFVNGSLWITNIRAARTVANQNLMKKAAQVSFVAVEDKLVPKESLSTDASIVSLPMAPDGSPTLPFQMALAPTKVRITGVGFFDSVHGQSGVCAFNGIEFHPVLKLEML